MKVLEKEKEKEKLFSKRERENQSVTIITNGGEKTYAIDNNIVVLHEPSTYEDVWRTQIRAKKNWFGNAMKVLKCVTLFGN